MYICPAEGCTTWYTGIYEYVYSYIRVTAERRRKGGGGILFVLPMATVETTNEASGMHAHLIVSW